MSAEGKINSLHDSNVMLKLSETQVNVLSDSELKINELTVLNRVNEQYVAELKLELLETRQKYESEMGHTKVTSNSAQSKISELLEINVLQENELRLKDLNMKHQKEEFEKSKKNLESELNSSQGIHLASS